MIALGLSLRNRIQLLIAGSVMGVSALILTALGMLAHAEIQRTVQEDVRATGGVLSQLIRERINALHDQCLLLSSRPSLRQGVQAADLKVVNASVRDCIRIMHAD